MQDEAVFQRPPSGSVEDLGRWLDDISDDALTAQDTDAFSDLDFDVLLRSIDTKKRKTCSISSSGSDEEDMSSLTEVEKKERRQLIKRERNRILAAESRERKKNRMGNLEAQNKELNRRVFELEAQLKNYKQLMDNCSCKDSHHKIVLQGTKMGTVAMVLTTSLVVLVDPNSSEAGFASFQSNSIAVWSLLAEFFDKMPLFAHSLAQAIVVCGLMLCVLAFVSSTYFYTWKYHFGPVLPVFISKNSSHFTKAIFYQKK